MIRSTNLTASFQTAMNSQPLPSNVGPVGKIGQSGDSVTLNLQPLPPLQVFANVKAALNATPVCYSFPSDFPDTPLHIELEDSDPSEDEGGGIGTSGGDVGDNGQQCADGTGQVTGNSGGSPYSGAGVSDTNSSDANVPDPAAVQAGLDVADGAFSIQLGSSHCTDCDPPASFPTDGIQPKVAPSDDGSGPSFLDTLGSPNAASECKDGAEANLFGATYGAGGGLIGIGGITGTYGKDLGAASCGLLDKAASLLNTGPENVYDPQDTGKTCTDPGPTGGQSAGGEGGYCKEGSSEMLATDRP